MKANKFFSLVILVIFVVSGYAVEKKSSYSGVWNLNKEKTTAQSSQIFLSKISINLKKDSVLTVRTYENANGETYPFNENLTLDGKEFKIVVYDLPRKAKANLSKPEGYLVIESTTTFTGNSGEVDFSLVETWKVSENGKELTVDFVAKSSAGESKGTNYFIKSE